MAKIMVVDDESIITMQLEKRLTSMGYDVVGKASSAEKSIDMARKLRPDLILMDIVMPGELDGIGASEVIRKELDIPVIFLTAYADDEMVKRAKDAMPYGYILKPFQEREVEAAIELAFAKRALEQQLHESEERHRFIVETAEDAIVCVDAQGEIMLWNPAAEAMFGYSTNEIMGKPATMIVPERFRDDLRSIMSRAISKGGSITIGKALEFYGLRKEGSELPLEISVATWATRWGRFATGILRDITERKQKETALRKSEQTAWQMSKTFVQSHDKEREQLAMEVHDRIAQTLVGAFLQLQTLETIPQKDAVAKRLLSRAIVLLQDGIFQCRNIMEALYSPVLHDFGLVAKIDEDMRRFQEDTGRRAQFDARCPQRLPPDVEVTAYRIFHEALTNVRRHATDAKEVKVSLVCKGQILDLQVKDDGSGFDARAETQIEQVGGLMVMRRRAELRGGTFEVTSAPGKGTTVHVQLPLSAGNET